MSVKNVYLKKKISGVVYDIYPHTDAGLVAYGNTTVASKLDALTTAIGNVSTTEAVQGMLDDLRDEIVGVLGENETIDQAYDTIKEIAAYLATNDDAIGIIASNQSRITALETTVNTANTGLTAKVAALEGTVGDNTAGLVKDVADNASDISALQTAVSGLGGVYVVASVPNDADENSLYVVVEETPSEEPSGD